jgi:hypothetical protein
VFSGLPFVLIPEPRELRRIPRYALTDITDPAGNYKLTGVIPGDYFLFAAPKSGNHAYFAPEFADRQRGGERVPFNSRGTVVVNLQAFKTR